MGEGHSCLQGPPQVQGHEGIQQGRKGQKPDHRDQRQLVNCRQFLVKVANDDDEI